MITCVAVRLKDIRRISARACVAVDFEGNEAILPLSTVYGPYVINGELKPDTYWVAKWILEKKNLKYNSKNTVQFLDCERDNLVNEEFIIEHVPEPKEPVIIEPENDLLR